VDLTFFTLAAGLPELFINLEPLPVSFGLLLCCAWFFLLLVGNDIYQFFIFTNLKASEQLERKKSTTGREFMLKFQFYINQLFTMRLRNLFCFFLLLAAGASLQAATVDTVQTFSPSMKKNIKAVIIKPGTYNTGNQFPVVYLLHGYSDNYASWVVKAGDLQKHADLYNMIIVCPDGGFSSWYLDSPEDPSYKYETYISDELVKWVDKNYKTIAERRGRGITGLSMGGHGALYLAFRHQDVYGAAGSMSGGVDIRPFPNNWDMAKRLGRFSDKPDNWEKNTVVNLLYLLTPNALALMIDCGSEDFFYKVNVSLHQKLMERNIPHDFISRPGAHNWPYWNIAIRYQLLFMHGFFNKQP
jgi:S-formylglutathione hydrolase FrmB